MNLDVDEVRDALLAGYRIRMVVGIGPEDPTLILWLEDGMVISRSWMERRRGGVGMLASQQFS